MGTSMFQATEKPHCVGSCEPGHFSMASTVRAAAGKKSELHRPTQSFSVASSSIARDAAVWAT